jgi:membrane-bound ClpP family serine protease
MTTIAILFIAGVILLAAEVFVPGGILGVLAGIAMITGCALAFVDYGVGGGLTAVAVALVIVGVVLYIEFAILPKTAMGKRLFLQSSVSGKSSADRDHSLVGQSGEAATALAPSGYVLIGNKRHEAFSRSGFLDEGTAVKVVGIDNFRLIVIPESPEA